MADYTVNLADPTVRSLLGDAPLATGKREMVQLAGDAPDPWGAGMLGQASTYRLSAQKQEVAVTYGQGAMTKILTVDVYALPGEPIKIHLYCPRCHKHSTIQGEFKKIDFDPRAMNPRRQQVLEHAPDGARPELLQVADFGRLSVEPFECAWEIGDGKHVPGALHTGASLCRLRIGIDNNRAYDA